MSSFNTALEGGFILMGFSDWPHLEHIFFVFISMFYFLTIFGNFTIITISRMDRRLQTPMYFFLNNLSFLDLCYNTSIVPQLLVNISGIDKTMSYAGCMTQFFIVLLLGGTECMLLVVMAFDRYVAVCHPLHYTSIMHPLLCHALAISSWVGGLVNSLTQTSLIMTIPLCGHHLNHFFCEMLVLLKLACEDTVGTEANLFVAGAIIFGLSCSTNSRHLCTHCSCSVEDQVKIWAQKGSGDLWVPPYCGFSFLWLSHVHVSPTCPRVFRE